METLVATVLIVVIFMLSSMLLNSLFANTMVRDNKGIKQELLLLEYQLGHNRFPLPYESEWENWQISIWSEGERTVLSAIEEGTKREITYEIE